MLPFPICAGFYRSPRTHVKRTRVRMRHKPQACFRSRIPRLGARAAAIVSSSSAEHDFCNKFVAECVSLIKEVCDILFPRSPKRKEEVQKMIRIGSRLLRITIAALCAVALAQVNTASLTGLVKDPTGAVISKAAVKARSTTTGI